jgi:hypothetical protein
LIEREGQFAEHKFLIQEYETCMESKWVWEKSSSG